MSEEEFTENQKNWFEPRQASTIDFFWKCEKWMKDVMVCTEQAEESARVQRDESVYSKASSKRSKRSSSHRSSIISASSMKIKAEIERASLEAKAAALKEKLAIEEEEVEFEAEQKRKEAAIRAKKEMHVIQTAIVESDA